MSISKEIQKFLLDDSIKRFLRYVKIWTTSDENSKSFPSTNNQIEFGKLLAKELNQPVENISLTGTGSEFLSKTRKTN